MPTEIVDRLVLTQARKVRSFALKKKNKDQENKGEDDWSSYLNDLLLLPMYFLNIKKLKRNQPFFLYNYLVLNHLFLLSLNNFYVILTKVVADSCFLKEKDKKKKKKKRQ
jgi:hypothetical protein